MPTPPSDLDFGQCIQGAYDDAKGRLRVDAEITASIIAPPGLEVSISSVDDNIAIRNSNNTNELLINPDGSIKVNQGTGGLSAWKVDGSAVTQPISAVSLPLPTGASTSANQTTANTSLSSIDSKLIDFHTTAVQTVQVFTKPYDSITATYPSATQEVYQSRVGGTSGTVQETVTVNYTDSTKVNFLNLART